MGLGKEIKGNHEGNIFPALCVFNCRNYVFYFKKKLYKVIKINQKLLFHYTNTTLCAN